MKATQTSIKEPVRVPKELLKEISSAKFPMTIGIPKENRPDEKRLVFTPEAVDMIVEAGHQILFESGAGAGVNYSDAYYSESGAIITNKEEVFNCDLVFKIAPATLEEISMMKKKATICSMLHFPDMSVELIHAMTERTLNAIGYELITSDGRNFPVQDSVSEIDGIAAISVASELLNNERGGKGILLGGIPGVSPAEIIIIGAGAAGRVAARAALALGALVKVFDNDILKLRQLQKELGTMVFTSVFQPNVLMNVFRSADVVIGALPCTNEPVRYLISADVIRRMKKGSLIIDLRINQGGCFETTCFLPENHPKVFEKGGVIHYCEPNISSRVARTTSMAMSNIFMPMIIRMGESSLSGITQSDTVFRSGLYMYSGKLVNTYVAKRFNLPANDIGLFLSAF
ncbi:MAG: alanine dehydrogenase [Dysgonamonadaceae bacterium]|jgi:alanine dehydrogenase|nr:alanine dehydrogenase [Dysgonamonadaceae bacterium]